MSQTDKHILHIRCAPCTVEIKSNCFKNLHQKVFKIISACGWYCTLSASRPAWIAGAKTVSVSRVSANMVGICSIRLSITASDSVGSHRKPSRRGINMSCTSPTTIICGWARQPWEEEYSIWFYMLKLKDSKTLM